MINSVPFIINGDFELMLPDYRAKQPIWTYPEGWEKPRLRAIHDRISDTDVVYEVGAEEGEMSALYRIWGAKVALFEPQRRVWPNIKAVWDANNLGEPLAAFVGFASTETALLDQQLIHGWPDCAHGTVTGTNHGFIELYNAAESNAQITIDDVAAQIAPPTVMCVDVEGAEFQVLKGAKQTLLAHRPTLFMSIHPEYMFHQWGQYSRELRGWLISELNYRETIIDYQHELHCMYEPQ